MKGSVYMYIYKIICGKHNILAYYVNPIYPEDQNLTVPEAVKIFFVKVD